MNFSTQTEEPGKKFAGVFAVAIIHVVVIYALLNGLGKQVVSFVKQTPIEVKIIEEVKPPPPPPPPPEIKPPTHRVTPPKPFIPLPEVHVQQKPSPNAIQAISVAPPEHADFHPQEPATTTSDKPANGPSVVSAVVDFTTCDKPSYPRNSLVNGEHGLVRLRFLIDIDGRVAETKIEKSSSHRELDAAANTALSLCKFKPGTVDGKPQKSWTTVDYIWKLP